MTVQNNQGLDIHLIGICGTGMGSFAGLLKRAGHRVRGSDQNVYPPMSTKLQTWGINVAEGYSPENLEPKPDLVVIGNVIRRDNPEAQAAISQNLPYASFPQALGDIFLKDKKSIVVAGTHGKTTTSSLVAWLLVDGGQDPGALIGGVPENFQEGFRLGQGRCFVVEGDEYDTAFFDKRPKFLHYRPQVAILTSLEFDHADIYPNIESIESRFDELIQLIPSNGRILACASAERVMNRVLLAKVEHETYSARPGIPANWTAENISFDASGTLFDLVHNSTTLGRLHLPMSGWHNLENAIAAIAVALDEGISIQQLQESLSKFEGISRRQSIKAEVNNIRIIDDFAHHPTAVKETLDGLKARYADGRLFAVFEPRTATSARKYFQEAYAEVFNMADSVVIAGVGRKELAIEERLDTEKLAKDINLRGTEARSIESIHDIVTYLAESLKPHDTVVFMSNGGFGGIHELIENELKARYS